MKHRRTTRLQALGLAAAGVLAALALVELGLRAAGSVLAFRQAAQARPRAFSPGASRVLCLGESTTSPTWFDHSWPRQLQDRLDADYPGRFSIVNEGMDGTNTAAILDRLPRLLEEHRPALVIAMTGINDPEWYGLAWSENGSGFPRRLKLYKAARWVYESLLAGWAPRTGALPLAHETLARTLRARGIPLILMQYPGIDGGGLCSALEQFPDAACVDNKPAFDAALRTVRYEDLFQDRFAGNWGHCTARGDALIADNAFRAVTERAAPQRTPGAKPPRPRPVHALRGPLPSWALTSLRRLSPEEKLRARREFDATLRRTPDDPETLLAVIELLESEPAAAIPYANRGLLVTRASAPYQSRFYCVRARLRSQVGQRREALEDLDRLPGGERCALDLRWRLLEDEDPGKALAVLEEDIRLGQHDSQTMADLEAHRSRLSSRLRDGTAQGLLQGQ